MENEHIKKIANLITDDPDILAEEDEYIDIVSDENTDENIRNTMAGHKERMAKQAQPRKPQAQPRPKPRAKAKDPLQSYHPNKSGPLAGYAAKRNAR